MDDDILSDVLRAVRLSGAVFFDVSASPPWVSAAPPSRQIIPLVMDGAGHVIEYHLMVSGTCWARLADGSGEPVEMTAGSVVVFPRGDAHIMASDPILDAPPVLDAFEQARMIQPYPFHLEQGPGGDDPARFICGFLGCDLSPFNPLISALPRMLHVNDSDGGGDGRLGRLMEMTLQESQARRPGGGGILAKLSELIFIEAVRRHAESGQLDGGWLAGLRDPQIGRALRLLHADPARAWTLAGLAREVGVSRTVLAERFTDCLGLPPMSYLANWRMQLAAGRLSSGGDTLARIAHAVGYESEAAFSRAFKRSTGLAPSAWRKRAASAPPAMTTA